MSKSNEERDKSPAAYRKPDYFYIFNGKRVGAWYPPQKMRVFEILLKGAYWGTVSLTKSTDIRDAWTRAFERYPRLREYPRSWIEIVPNNPKVWHFGSDDRTPYD